MPRNYPYHLAEAKRVSVANVVAGGIVSAYSWRAQCKCGWIGATRDTKDAAESDACAHDVTENEA